jgi:hypothetical protein
MSSSNDDNKEDYTDEELEQISQEEDLFKFKHGQRSLLKSPFWWPNQMIACTSDACGLGFHAQCPRQARTQLLDIQIRCDCWCHRGVKKTIVRKGKGGSAALDLGCERPTSSRCEPSRAHTPQRTQERMHNG